MAVIGKNIEKTRLSELCRVFCADVSDYIRTVGGRRKFDIVFIDPPYALRALPATLESLLKWGLLKPTSVVVCESEESDIFESSPELREKFEILRCAKYGVAHITVIKPFS